MVGRRQRSYDIGGGGLLSQRTGQLDQPRQTLRKSDSRSQATQPVNTKSHRREPREKTLLRSRNPGEDIPVLLWSQDSESPQGSRSGYSETASWRQFQDDRERDKITFYSAVYGDGSSSIGTEATDVRVDHFIDHLERLESRENRSKILAQKTRRIGKTRSRIRRGTKKQHDDRSLNESSSHGNSEDELDKLVLRSSSSDSNGASEWFKTLLQGAASWEKSNESKRKGKGSRRVTWKSENQEFQLPCRSEHETQDPILDQRTPRSTTEQSWEQASAEFRTLFHDNDPDSILQTPPRQPSRLPRSSINQSVERKESTGDWDFDQQIFPSSSSSLDEKAIPREQESTDTSTLPPAKDRFDDSIQRRNKSAESNARFDASRSPPESLQSQNSISGEKMPESRSIHDPPTTNSSLQDRIRNPALHVSMFLEDSLEENEPLRIANLTTASSSCSQLDPDGVLLDTNGESDESAIHNQFLQNKPVYQTSTSRKYGAQERARPGEDMDKSPRSTWIPVSPPTIMNKREQAMSRDPSPEQLKKILLQSLQSNNHASSSVSGRDDDDESSLFSDLLSAVDQRPQVVVSASKALGRVSARKGHRYSNKNRGTADTGTKAPSSVVSQSSQNMSSHPTTFAENDTRSTSATEPPSQSDVSLFDATSSSESESDDTGSRTSQVENMRKNFFPRRQKQGQSKKAPIPISTTSVSVTNDDQDFTPVFDNRAPKTILRLSGKRLPSPEDDVLLGTRTPIEAVKSSSFPTPVLARTTTSPIPFDVSNSAEMKSSLPVESASWSPIAEETENHHPPFTSVRDTVASPHETGSRKDFFPTNATSISVGQERDGHRPFTSVRETVASLTHYYHASAADMASPSSCVGGRSKRSSDKPSYNPNLHETARDSQRDAKEEQNEKTAVVSALASEKAQAKTCGRARDYWKSIRALKTLGSFDSLSAINDPQRKARRSQEFVDRDEPRRMMRESLAHWNELRLSTEQPVSKTFSDGQQKHVSFRQDEEVTGIPLYRSTQINDITLSSNRRRINLPSAIVQGSSVGPQSVVPESSKELYDESTVQVQRSGTSESSQITGAELGEKCEEDDEGWTRGRRQWGYESENTRDHSRELSPTQKFASQNLLSRDSEDSTSTDDPNDSVLHGGTTVGQGAACCSFTVGDLSWGFEWLRSKME